MKGTPFRAATFAGSPTEEGSTSTRAFTLSGRSVPSRNAISARWLIGPGVCSVERIRRRACSTIKERLDMKTKFRRCARVVIAFGALVSAGLPLVLYMRREAAGPALEHGLDH